MTPIEGNKKDEIDPNVSSLSLPRVSIVLVNKNGCKWLKLFMSHLYDTQYPDFEVIVVDNASQDESVEFLKENFPDIRLVLLDENKGFGEGTNIGAADSTGEVLAFVNNDMEVSPDWLTEGVMKLTSDATIAAVQSKILRYKNRDEIDLVGLSVDRYNFFQAIGSGENDTGQYDHLREIGASSGGAMIIWKYIFNKVGGFDNFYFMYHEDIDLCWRLRLAGYRICPAPSSVVYHVGSASSNVRSSDEFRPSPFFAFVNSRNIAYCWLKNSSLRTIIIYWPIFLFGNLLISFFLFASAGPRVGFAYFEGLLWPIKHFRQILEKRKNMNLLFKERKDNLLFVKGVVKESSNFSTMLKRIPFVLKRMAIKNKIADYEV